ncbi:MAG: phosphate acyltransferase PlsX [Lachnospiraceae bacterium]|nr:phosphate acyltransferase PlsX [Lachnospiraceae bacterium]
MGWKARVAVDAMGGDNAPFELVKGTVEAVNECSDVKCFLVGDRNSIENELAKYTYNKEAIEIKEATENISCDEPPVYAIRRKKDSSIVVGLNLIKNNEADSFISAGSTGAVLVGAQLIAGRIKGIERTPLAPLIPTLNGCALLIDCGANVDSRASHLLQYARMGSIYMENIVGIKNPRVAIVNIGTEEEKGNALVKETYPLLKNCSTINFVGSIESRQIPYGDADVIVCDAFVGNVILKMYEGVAGALLSKIKGALTSTPLSTVGAALINKPLKKTLKGFSMEEYGGAPMLGLNGLVMKTHGNSESIEIKNSILQAVKFAEADIIGKIKMNINSEE